VREYLAAAQARASRMVPIIINCQEGENLKRLAAAERSLHGKLMDVELLRTIREDERGVFRFEAEEARRLGQIEIDVTDLKVEEAAGMILRHVWRVCPELEALGMDDGVATESVGI
jgi:regulator of PEP synthase PpsR (kinase-PPPase family)